MSDFETFQAFSKDVVSCMTYFYRDPWSASPKSVKSPFSPVMGEAIIRFSLIHREKLSKTAEDVVPMIDIEPSFFYTFGNKLICEPFVSKYPFTKILAICSLVTYVAHIFFIAGNEWFMNRACFTIAALCLEMKEHFLMAGGWEEFKKHCTGLVQSALEIQQKKALSFVSWAKYYPRTFTFPKWALADLRDRRKITKNQYYELNRRISRSLGTLLEPGELGEELSGPFNISKLTGIEIIQETINFPSDPKSKKVAKWTEDLTKHTSTAPKYRIPKWPGDIPKDTGGLPKWTTEISKWTGDIHKTYVDVKKGTGNVKKLTGTVKKSTPSTRATPKSTVTISKSARATQKSTATSSKSAETSPKSTSSKSAETSPKSTATTSKSAETSPKSTATTSKSVGTSQKSTVTVSKSVGTSQKSNLPFKQRWNITEINRYVSKSVNISEITAVSEKRWNIRNRPLPFRKALEHHRNRPLPVQKVEHHRNRPLPVRKALEHHRNRLLPVRKALEHHRNRLLPFRKVLEHHRNRPLPFRKLLEKHRNQPTPFRNRLEFHKNQLVL
ncbi:uncharacterized protein NPIL_57091 [Nephila pilipes]|uniref:Uncharacterized protein n=1 Tax=Nephila pilipes TaxID=299642 RepID=A0A8X6MYS1_NEPPI|nr:uncharacterized protein NPIL_57091 [Nephila pilipes]